MDHSYLLALARQLETIAGDLRQLDQWESQAKVDTIIDKYQAIHIQRGVSSFQRLVKVELEMLRDQLNEEWPKTEGVE